jgi:hypothetical protein
MPPPAELSPEQAAIWNRISGRLPDGWITDENAALLVQYARHSVYADQLSRDIEAARASPETKPAAVHALMRAHVLQSRCMATLATKLRLTKLSQYVRSSESAAIAARNAGPSVKPWEDWPGGGQQ